MAQRANEDAGETVTTIGKTYDLDGCGECLERRLNWTQNAGRRAALKEVETMLRERSGTLFARALDVDARTVRGLADEVRAMVKDADESADRCQKIYESGRSPHNHPQEDA